MTGNQHLAAVTRRNNEVPDPENNGNLEREVLRGGHIEKKRRQITVVLENETEVLHCIFKFSGEQQSSDRTEWVSLDLRRYYSECKPNV